MNLKQFMSRYAIEEGHFERILHPHSPHRDLCAMLILSKFMNGKTSVINTASSNGGGMGMIVFEPTIHDVANMATEQQVIDLIRCGVRYNGEYHALVMDI